MPDAKSDKVKIFISYARDDAEQVSEIYHRLKAAGYDPWIDSEDLLPGVKWKDAIIKAVREADLFLLCVSPRSSNRQGFIQREIKLALDQLEEKTFDQIYFIPVRLEECELPEKVDEFQCVNWFEAGAWEKLEKALRIQAEKMPGKKLPKPKPPSPLKPPSFPPDVQPGSFVTRYKTAIWAASVLILMLIGVFGLGYFITYRPFNTAPSTPMPTPVDEKSIPPADYAELLRYSLESDGKTGFRFRFRAAAAGYLYVIGSMDNSGKKEEWIYLSNNPDKDLKVKSNELKPNSDFPFPAGDGITIPPAKPERFTLIWSATRLQSLDCFSSEMRFLTKDEVAAIKKMLTQSELRNPIPNDEGDWVILKALPSSTVPVVKYIDVRWPK